MRKLSKPSNRSTLLPRFSFRRPLVAALASLSFLSCEPRLPERPGPPKIHPSVMSTPVKKKKPAMKAPPMKAPVVMKPKPMKPPKKKRVKKFSRRKCGSFCHLYAKGYGNAAPILHKRTTQKKKKMKLTPEEGSLAASYLIKDLPKMPKSEQLLEKLPKVTVELIRSVNERGVTRRDAEEMADYLIRFLKSIKIRRVGTFDECISHMIGREWHEIDYSGERMTWQGQKRLYNRREEDWVKNIKEKIYLHRFLYIERRMRYFWKLFRPRGKMPKL